MPDDPDTADLIATARAALKDEVLPHLPADRRYPALMVLNALGIAGRQLAGGGNRRDAARRRLAELAGDGGVADLGAAIRRGEFAGDRRELHAALSEMAEAETAESNPRARALAAVRGDQKV